VSLLLSLLLLSDVAYRGAVGAQIDADPHGAFDVGVRSGPWSAELFTETIDLRYTDRADDHRFTLGLRGELFAAGLMTSPWTDGAPDPSRARTAAYAGLDAEYVFFGPAGAYLSLAASAREYFFGAIPGGIAADPELVLGPTLRLGLWTSAVRGSVALGFDLLAQGSATVAPRIEATLRVRPSVDLGPLAVGPWLEGWGAFADGQDDTTLTRIGGLNPYVVPLAGAGWAEWWAEDYLAGRAGIFAAFLGVDLAIVIDAAHLSSPLFTTRDEWGAGVVASGRWGSFFAELSGGYTRERFSGWGRVGLAWSDE